MHNDIIMKLFRFIPMHDFKKKLSFLYHEIERFEDSFLHQYLVSFTTTFTQWLMVIYAALSSAKLSNRKDYVQWSGIYNTMEDLHSGRFCRQSSHAKFIEISAWDAWLT